MRSYLIDTNVIIDAADPDSPWYAWSAAQLISASNDGAVFINPIIYAELAGYADSESQIASILSDMLLERADLPWEAAFRAGRAFVAYRRAGGTKTDPGGNESQGRQAQGSRKSVCRRARSGAVEGIQNDGRLVAEKLA